MALLAAGAVICSAEVTHFAPRQLRSQVLARERKRFPRGSLKLHESRNAEIAETKKLCQRNYAGHATAQTLCESKNPKIAEAPTRGVGEEDERISGNTTKTQQLRPRGRFATTISSPAAESGVRNERSCGRSGAAPCYVAC